MLDAEKQYKWRCGQCGRSGTVIDADFGSAYAKALDAHGPAPDRPLRRWCAAVPSVALVPATVSG